MDPWYRTIQLMLTIVAAHHRALANRFHNSPCPDPMTKTNPLKKKHLTFEKPLLKTPLKIPLKTCRLFKKLFIYCFFYLVLRHWQEICTIRLLLRNLYWTIFSENPGWSKKAGEKCNKTWAKIISKNVCSEYVSQVDSGMPRSMFILHCINLSIYKSKS